MIATHRDQLVMSNSLSRVVRQFSKEDLRQLNKKPFKFSRLKVAKPVVSDTVRVKGSSYRFRIVMPFLSGDQETCYDVKVRHAGGQRIAVQKLVSKLLKHVIAFFVDVLGASGREELVRPAVGGGDGVRAD